MTTTLILETLREVQSFILKYVAKMLKNPILKNYNVKNCLQALLERLDLNCKNSDTGEILESLNFNLKYIGEIFKTKIK